MVGDPDHLFYISLIIFEVVYMNSKDLTEITIDFEQLRKGALNDSLVTFFGFWIKKTLGLLLGDIDFAIPVKMKGTPAEIKSFVGALQKEKRYVQAYRQYGLDDPKTFKSRTKLKNSVSNFERITGLKWPFKH
tara:strand:+ start:70 stop:468 length:399 start_codon:yes stop_codon:yes gene_type:complete